METCPRDAESRKVMRSLGGKLQGSTVEAHIFVGFGVNGINRKLYIGICLDSKMPYQASATSVIVLTNRSGSWPNLPRKSPSKPPLSFS